MEQTGVPLSDIYKGIGHELKFWKGFVQTKRFIEGWLANVVTPELALDQAEVVEFIKGKLHAGVKVLDVGSGVVSILHGLVPAAQLTAVDPLALLYECIFDYKHYGIKPCICEPVENLASKFAGQFDIVHMRNALDHCQAPDVALQNLFECCRPGGYVIVHGFEDEAIAENWQGFHQYNIRIVDAQLQCHSKAGMIFNISPDVGYERKTLSNGKRWFICILSKQS